MTYEFFIAETPAKGAAKGILGKKDWTTVDRFVVDMVGGKKTEKEVNSANNLTANRNFPSPRGNVFPPDRFQYCWVLGRAGCWMLLPLDFWPMWHDHDLLC